MEIKKNYYPEEISRALLDLAGMEIFDECEEHTPEVRACTDALYQLMAIAENNRNSDFFRTLWDVLENLTERWNCGTFNAQSFYIN